MEASLASVMVVIAVCVVGCSFCSFDLGVFENFRFVLCFDRVVPYSREGFQNLTVIRWVFIHHIINIAFIGVRREMAWSA
ncbi:hypothetical protein K440DRAFT_628693 [Wilcoxina mikolae CBS 423.85]|nr:hypothetical protein K440DRAFT_628693 [Wilcoxina mikolae CBS 423.85]